MKMNFHHLLASHLLILTFFHSSKPQDIFHRFKDGDCTNTTTFAAKEYTLYCPSLDNHNLVIEVKNDEALNVVCFEKDANLTAVSLDLGDVQKFSSKNCNLEVQFREIFNLWNVRKTKQWDISHFSNDDFILTKDYFDDVDVSAVEELRIQRSNIAGVAPDTFDDFVKLKTVSLVENKIKDLPDLFKRSKSLQFLELAENQLVTLPDEFIAPALLVLQLWINELTAINEDLFVNATKLRILELTKNKIEYLPEKLLHPLVDLRSIGLTGNRFKRIPENFFITNKDLDDIRLGNLNLEEIPENIFAGLRNLSKLMLQMNSLRSLPKNIFKNLTNLREMYINGNRIEKLPENVFSHLENLEFLDLSNNSLTDWTSNHSKGLERLKTLNLSWNNLTYIESDSFYGLQNLKELYLRRNKISYIKPNGFNGLNLQTLDLSYNKLTTEQDLVTFINGLPPTLDVLLLQYNEFVAVPVTNIGKKLVDVSHNNITKVDLSDLLMMNEILLNDNQIEMIDFRLTNIVLGWEKTNRNKIKINIDNNPINCDCYSFNLIEYYDKTYANKNLLERINLVGTVRCASPPSLTGKIVNDLRSDEFTCDYSEIYECPERCSCSMYPKYGSFNVSCSDRGFETPPVMPVFVPARINSEEVGSLFTIDRLAVHLENNSIVNFTERDASYANASELYLSGNKLKLVSWIPEKLQILELNDNELNNLDFKVISTLNHTHTLKHLALHDNSWNCNCRLVNFTKLMISKNWEIPFKDKILCSDGRKVEQMTEGTLCTLENQIALIVIGACLFIFLITIGVGLIFYYKNEYHVKVWLYSKPLFMRFVAEDDLDKNKTYDAFISYSHQDEDFIVKELIPQLENGPESYKLCIHIRDWIVGEFITKQIIDSVENSRRTIIVLSKHFLESEWATMEFRTAHMQAMREKRHRLIVILYGDVDPNTIQDEELRTYLTTNTYVRWGDPWFWKKLKYVLPHKKYSSGNNNVKRRKMENIMVCIDKMDLINSPATPNLATPPAVSVDPLLLKADRLAFKSDVGGKIPVESGLVTSVTC